jgi:hypothetical protein
MATSEQSKPANKYIVYLIAAAAAVGIAAIFIYYYLQSTNPGNDAVKKCQDNANTLLTQYLQQFDAFQKANNNAPMTAQQNAELEQMYQNYQAAEGQCLATATQLQLADDFYNNILPIGITVAISAVIGVSGLAIYNRIQAGTKSKYPDAFKTPATATQTGENVVTGNKLENGDMSPDEASANISDSADRAAVNAVSDSSVLGEEIQQLVIDYESEAATLDAINTAILEEDDAADLIDSVTMDILGI